jgi:hypothetical protein
MITEIVRALLNHASYVASLTSLELARTDSALTTLLIKVSPTDFLYLSNLVPGSGADIQVVGKNLNFSIKHDGNDWVLEKQDRSSIVELHSVSEIYRLFEHEITELIQSLVNVEIDLNLGENLNTDLGNISIATNFYNPRGISMLSQLIRLSTNAHSLLDANRPRSLLTAKNTTELATSITTTTDRLIKLSVNALIHQAQMRIR